MRKTCMPGQGNLVGLEGTRSLLFYSTMSWLLRVVLKESAQIDFSVLLHFGYIFHGLILAYMLTSLKLIMIFLNLKGLQQDNEMVVFHQGYFNIKNHRNTFTQVLCRIENFIDRWIKFSWEQSGCSNHSAKTHCTCGA